MIKITTILIIPCEPQRGQEHPQRTPETLENLLSAYGSTGFGVCALGALQPVSVPLSLSGRGAAGQASGQPGVAPPLPAGQRSGGCRCRCCWGCWHCRGAATATASAATITTAMVDGQGQRLAVVVVLLWGIGAGGPWSALLPQVLVLLADSDQLALQLIYTPALSLQEFGLALDDVVELQEVLHCPVGVLWAGLHGERPGSRQSPPRRHRHHRFDPGGPDPPPPPVLMSGGEGGKDRDAGGD